MTHPADWAMALFRVSVLKQQKWRMLSAAVGPTVSLRCLDIGSDNGLISYLFRQQGGRWASADLSAATVASIRELVGTDVHQLDGGRTPFADGEFDRIVVVDFLEHIASDKAFLEELVRILKPGGELVLNVPHLKHSLLRRFRLAIGQTDERHGHVRPGYTAAQLTGLLGPRFTPLSATTYSKFFTEAVDTLITFAWGLVKRGTTPSSKGVVVTRSDLEGAKRLFRAYRVIYPLMWLCAQLDRLLVFRSGYMLLVKARLEPARVPAEVAR